MDAQESIPTELLQRRLTRLDFVEYTLVKQNANDVKRVRDDVDHIRRARLQEQEDTLIADAYAYAPRAQPQAAAPAPASHRGPGALVATRQDLPSTAPPRC